jgi:hypothetical protein
MERSTDCVGVHHVAHYSRHKDGPCKDLRVVYGRKAEAFVDIFALQWRQNP